MRKIPYEDVAEPIVNTPSEAIRLFFDSGLDAIFLGRLLVQKSWI